MGNKAAKEGAPPSDDGEDPEVVTSEQKSYWQMLKQGYQELVHAIIRPPRCNYEIAQLGPCEFDFCGKQFQRVDFELRNPRNMKLVCSMWEPAPACRPNDVLPCVIYMHGNASARLEAIPQLALVLSLGATLLSFDFSGSGLSDGDYVSLGAFERDDLQSVIEHLRINGKTSTIALWGRSMGAATALLHGERDPSIAGMVLDSSFADLTQLAEEMVEKGRQHGLFAPSLLVKLAIRFIRSSVQKEAGFDIRDLSPIEHADRCFIPALFVAAEGDAFIQPHHSQQIYQKYAGDKNVLLIDGDHNTPRPRFMQDSVAIFLSHTLQTPESWMLKDSQRFLGMLPWNIHKGGRKVPGSNVSSGSGGRVDIDPQLMQQLTALGISEEEIELGMTAERQADIQNKLHRVLGGTGAGSSGGRVPKQSNSRPPAPSKSETSSSSLPPAPPPPNENDETNGTADGERDVSERSTPTYNDTEWTCMTCTLINNPFTEFCSACGMPHPDAI